VIVRSPDPSSFRKEERGGKIKGSTSVILNEREGKKEKKRKGRNAGSGKQRLREKQECFLLRLIGWRGGEGR